MKKTKFGSYSSVAATMLLLFIQLLLVAGVLVVDAFAPSPLPAESNVHRRQLFHGRGRRGNTAFKIASSPFSSSLFSSNNSDSGDDESRSRDQKLSGLGFTDSEISSRQSSSPNDDLSVKVEEFEVDAFTLTAIGFALIAFNFFVFANAGDGGIGGVVAKIINLSNQ